MKDGKGDLIPSWEATKVTLPRACGLLWGFFQDLLVGKMTLPRDGGDYLELASVLVAFNCTSMVFFLN